MSADYCVPETVSEEGADLIKKLLVLNPNQRIGVNNIDDIKMHKFFDGIDFGTLHLQKAPVNSVAMVKSPHKMELMKYLGK